MKHFFACVLFVFGLVTLLLAARWVGENVRPGRRETTAHDVCRWYLRDIVVALHAYNDVHKQFPTGTRPNEDLPPEQRLSWQISLLPMVEQEAMYKKLDLQTGWNAEVNHAATQSWQYPVFYSPACDRQIPPGRVFPTTYVGVGGVGVDSPELPVDHPRAGFFGYDRVVRIQDIKDGTSNTMCVTETTWENGPWTAGGPATVRGLDPSRKPYLGVGRQFGGLHKGRTCIAMADGTVRCVLDSIDPRTLEALATIAGGEALPDDR